MGALTGSTISSSYDMLLKTATTGGVTSTLKVIEDGLGIDSALKLSTTVVSVDGEFQSTGDCLLLGGTLRIKDSGNTAQRGAIYGDADDFSIVAGVNNLKLSTAGGLAMTIDSYGYVGIGTAAPIGLLSLESEGDNFLQFELTGTGANVWSVGMDNNDGDFKIIDGAAGDTPALTIDTSGNVGIGCTPSEAVEVVGTSPSIKATASNVGGQAEIKLFGGSHASNEADKRAIVSDGDLIFKRTVSSSWVADMTIDSSGNVDIGTSGPSTTNARLHIHSGLELASDVALLISDFNNDATTYAMKIEDEDSGGELFSLKSDGGVSSGKVDMMVTGEVIATGIPTSSDGSGLTTGTIYKETSTGYLKIA
jgi:hypothetical protein